MYVLPMHHSGDIQLPADHHYLKVIGRDVGSRLPQIQNISCIELSGSASVAR